MQVLMRGPVRSQIPGPAYANCPRVEQRYKLGSTQYPYHALFPPKFTPSLRKLKIVYLYALLTNMIHVNEPDRPFQGCDPTVS